MRYQEFTILLKLWASSPVLPPVLGFYHLSESEITTDVLGRHFTVETEKVHQEILLFKDWKLGGHLPTGLLLHTALKDLLTINCGFWEQVIKKVSKRISGAQKVRKWHLQANQWGQSPEILQGWVKLHVILSATQSPWQKKADFPQWNRLKASKAG